MRDYAENRFWEIMNDSLEGGVMAIEYVPFSESDLKKAIEVFKAAEGGARIYTYEKYLAVYLQEFDGRDRDLEHADLIDAIVE